MTVIDKFSCRAKLLMVFFLILFSHQCALSEAVDWRSVKEITVPGDDLIFTGSAAYRMGDYSAQLSMDIDNDGSEESIFLIKDLNSDGYVFKLGGSGVDLSKGNLHDLKGWISCVGSFNSYNNYWGVDGNVVRFKRSQTGYDYGIKVYVDGKLRDVAD